MGFAAKELEQTEYGINVVKGGATRNLRRAGDNCRYPTCVRGVVAVPQKLEMGEDSLEIVDSIYYSGDMISVRDRIFCTWSNWRELASLLVNHSIPLELLRMCEACIAVCCRDLGTNRKTGRTACYL